MKIENQKLKIAIDSRAALVLASGMTTLSTDHTDYTVSLSRSVFWFHTDSTENTEARIVNSRGASGVLVVGC